jgi:hypothetical protein
MLQQLAEDNEHEESENLNSNENKIVCEADDTYTCISNELPFSRSPRYVHETLVFLGSEHSFISHDACMGLYKYKNKMEVIVPIVEFPKEEGGKVANMGFPGLFLGQLPINCGIDKKKFSYNHSLGIISKGCSYKYKRRWCSFGRYS